MPLHRPQLKVLLIILLAMLILAVLAFDWKSQDDVGNPAQTNIVTKNSDDKTDPAPSETDIKKQLEALKQDSDATQPSEEDIKKQLEQLKAPEGTSQPSQEDIRNQLEQLKKR